MITIQPYLQNAINLIIGLAVVIIMRQKGMKTFSFNVWELFKESIRLSFINTVQSLKNMDHVYRCLLFTLPGFSACFCLSACAIWPVSFWLLFLSEKSFERPSKKRVYIITAGVGADLAEWFHCGQKLDCFDPVKPFIWCVFTKHLSAVQTHRYTHHHSQPYILGQQLLWIYIFWVCGYKWKAVDLGSAWVRGAWSALVWWWSWATVVAVFMH